MKKYISLFTLAILFFVSATAQESPRNLVKMSPFYLIDNTFLLGYEHFSKDFKTSFEIQAGVIASSNPIDGSDGFTSGFMGEFYIKKHIVNRFAEPAEETLWLEGVYFAPYLQYKYIKSKFTPWNGPFPPNTMETEVHINSIGVGTVFGMHISIVRGFYLEPYLGGGVKFGSLESNPPWERQWLDVFSPEYTGIYPKLGLKIGAKL